MRLAYKFGRCNMNKYNLWQCMVVVLLTLTFLGVSCAAKEVLAPVTPAIPKSTIAPLASSVAAITPEEAAWAKVVEAAKKERQLVVYGGGTFAGDTGITIAKAFKEKYGITVD